MYKEVTTSPHPYINGESFQSTTLHWDVATIMYVHIYF